MLDTDLAKLYGVSTKALNQAVKRNTTRFPGNFIFTNEETITLRSQFVTSKSRGGRQYRPYAFTEQGVAMLSSVLKSSAAIAVNIEIMRAFVELRRFASSYAELHERLEKFERETLDRLDGHDEQMKEIFRALHQLINPPPEPKRPVGFRVRGENG